MRRFRQLYIMPCRYQVFVMVASLFWVRGFLLPTQLRKLEVKPKNILSHEHQSLGGLATIRQTLLNIRSTKQTDPATAGKAKGHGIKVKKRRTWDDYFPRLKDFYSENGHSNVAEEDDPDLFQFVSSLRKNYRRQVYHIRESSKNSDSSKTQELPDEKMQSLENIEFVWYIPKKKKTWKEYYPRLKNFHSKHGHCNVSPEEDKDLNQYVTSLRNNYAPESTVRSSKSKRRLSDDKLQALKDLDFSWEKSPPPKTVRPGGRTWEEYFPLLKAFHKEYGHTNVTSEDDPDLFQYVSSLRKNYRHQYVFGNSSKTEANNNNSYKWLPTEKFQALQDLRFSWYSSDSRTMKVRGRKTLKHKSRQPRRMWNEYYPKLEAFRDAQGHCNVTSKDDKDLYLWLKSLERRHKLSEDKLQALQKLGVSLLKPSERRRLQMEEMIPRLKSHQEKFGRVAVDRNEDSDLSEWATKYIRQNGYPKLWELIGLRPVDGKWREGYWEKMFQRLSEHHSKTGHCQVDSNSDSELEYFVRDQRREYLRWRTGLSTILTMDRIESLEELGFEWVKNRPTIRKTHEERWNDMVEELTAYREEYGHTEIPQEFEDNPQLGRWVMNQRTFYRMNQIGIYTSLTDERIEQLENLDFVWGVREKHWWTMYGRLKDYQKIHGHLVIEVADFVNEDLRQWLNEQRYFYKSNTKGHRLSRERIEALQSLPGFRWSGKRAKIPTKDDWSQLLGAIRDRGITPDAKPKEHWFDGVNRFEDEVKSVYSDEDLLALWNEENDPDDKDEDGDNYFEDEDSRLFLRA